MLAAAALAVFLFALPVLAALHAAGEWVTLFRATAYIAQHPADAADASLRAWSVWPGSWIALAAAGAAAVAAAIGASTATGALGISLAALAPRISRLSMRSGIRQLISLQGALHAAGAALAVAIIAWAVVPAIRALIELASLGYPPGIYVMALSGPLRATWLRIAVGLSALALAEIWWTRRRAFLALRMTPREVREERAETEGRPELRSRRRAHAANIARDIGISAIRTASAIVVNPTHVAVALRYAPPTIDVPTVVSRGADLAALLVRSAAALHDVPIVESPELAQALYARLRVGQAIPEDCYAAVAAVFAWLIRTRGGFAGATETGA